ncbi:MAG: hypothetical protein LBV02_00790, partial [Bacteroidales bacterium]|nr:hypothetical protein [Bacteroidales bacterium]
MKLKTFLTILFSLSFLSLLSTETPFDWPHNLEKSDEVAQVKITDVQGEKVTATVVQSFTPEIRNGKKITFINNDPSANFSVDHDYFVFLKNGKKKNQYALPAAANLPVSDTVVTFNFSSGEAPYKHAVSDLSEFLNVYYHTELRPGYCDKLFRVIEHSSAKQWIDDRAKEAISQYLILNPEGSGKIKDFLRENFLQFIHFLQDMNVESYGEGVLFRGIQYMNIMKDLGIWNLESYFYDFMREFNGLSFQFRENPELFPLKKAKEDSLLALINETKPDFLPAGQWTVWVR